MSKSQPPKKCSGWNCKSLTDQLDVKNGKQDGFKDDFRVLGFGDKAKLHGRITSHPLSFLSQEQEDAEKSISLPNSGVSSSFSPQATSASWLPSKGRNNFRTV